MREILQTVIREYDVVFTYLDENVDSIYLVPPSGSLQLTEIITYLQASTGLVFTRLDDRFFSIAKPEGVLVTICGYLKDAASGEDIPGAHVLSQNKGVATLHNGYFSLDRVSIYDTLTFSALGYRKYRLPVRDNTAGCLTFYMDQQDLALEEVVVHQFLTKGITKRSDGSLVINNMREGLLPGMTGQDVLYSIQALPGIQSNNETVSDINIRGGTHDQNLILWDGVRIYQPGHFFGLISALNPYVVENVRVIKNGTSPQYDEGVSGTLDIRTEDKVADTVRVSAGLNLLNGDMLIKVPLSPKASLHLASRRSEADLWQTPTYKQYYDRAFQNTDVTRGSQTIDSLAGTGQNFFFYDLSARFLYDPSPKDKWRISFLSIGNTIQYEEEELVNQVPMTRISSLDQSTQAGAFSQKHSWHKNLMTEVQGYYSAYSLRAINHDILHSQRLLQVNDITEWGGRLNAYLNLSNHSELLAGYQLNETGIQNIDDINNPDFRRQVKNVLVTHSFYSEWDYSSTMEQTRFRLGARVNYYEKFKKAVVEPRLSFYRKLGDYLGMEILAEVKNQTSTQVIDFQTDFLGIEKRRWILSDDLDIPIISSKQFSVGVQYQKNGYLLSWEGYFKQVNDVISSSQGFLNQFQYIRTIGDFHVRGIDVLANKKFDRSTTWVNYAWAKNTFEFPELIPPDFPHNLDVTHTLNLGSSYEYRQMEFSTGITYRSGMPYTPLDSVPIVENRLNYDLPNSRRMHYYLRADMSWTYHFLLGEKAKAMVGMSVWNLLNRQNVYATYFQLTGQSKVETIRRKALGITPNLTFRISF